MIVDWWYNCNNIFKTKELSKDDPSENKHSLMQEIVYIKYLMEVKRFSLKKTFLEWCQIKNGSAQAFNDKDDKRIQFNALYAKTTKRRYRNLNVSRKLLPINIYREELEYVNSIRCPLWTKKYWLCLLAYYKFMRQSVNRVEKSKTLNAWASRMAGIDNYGSYAQDAIARYRIASGKKVIVDYPKMECDMYPTYVPDFYRESGDVALVVTDINDLDKLLSKVEYSVAVCPMCNKEFDDKMGQTPYCPDCYKIYRKNYLVEQARRRRKKIFFENSENEEV